MLPIEVEMENFCRHRKFRVVYSDGLNLVIGPNGAGKSTAIPEAIAWGVWGEMIRGTRVRTRGLPATSETKVGVVFTHNGATYRTLRTATAKRTTFTWSRDGQTPLKYETSTKAQQALEAEVGDLVTWQSTSLFSGDDAAMFSRATDTQRKKLLEKMLGLERLDIGCDNARKSLNALKLRLAGARQRLSRTEGQVEALTASLEQLEQLGGVSTAVGDAQSELELTQSELQEQEEAQKAIQTSLTEARLESDRAARAVTRVLGGKCVACNQVVPVDLLEKQTREANQAERKFAALSAELAHKSRERTQAISSLRARLQSVQAKLTQAKAAARYQVKVDEISDQLGDLYISQLEQEAELQAIEQDYLVQEHVVRVLGPKGVRAQRLRKVLSSISKLANTYLTWLSPGIRVKILPYTELASGQTSDQFSLVVDGGGDGTYASNSGGERRRVDIALVLALSQLRKSEMVITDDLLDALDEEGVTAVCRLLVDIAKRRRVVLLTHTQNKELTEVIKSFATQVITIP